MRPAPTPLPDDVERAMPRGSRVPWERRLLRLVEPADRGAPAESPEPESVEPPESAPLAERLAYWERRATWATTADQYDEAVRALARLQRGHHEAAESVPGSPAATLAPKTRPVLHREVIGRDEHGRIAKTREWTEDVPISESEPTALPRPGETSTEISRSM